MAGKETLPRSGPKLLISSYYITKINKMAIYCTSMGVMTCSARTNTGIQEIWDTILEYKTLSGKNGYFEKKRLEQSRYWMYETINQNLKDSFYHDRRIQKMLEQQESRVLTGETTPFTPARVLMEKYFKRHWIKFNYRRR